MWTSFTDSVLGFFEGVLTVLHDVVVPVFGVHSWGWAIILLTLIVRIFLLPLAIKQTRSMRGMQAIQPKMKEIQKKYKVDRELMRKDPEKYRAKKQKMNEEMMALYQEEGVNPAASCLPLLAQAPVFIALFWTIRGMEELADAPFYFFTDFISPGEDGITGLGALVSTAGWPGWLLIVVMSGTMFITQKQMMARTAATGQDNPMAQQQKILLYVMPLFLAVVSFQFALGLLLYWVTTNVWQVIQQWIILREVKQDAASGPATSSGDDRPATGKGGATSGRAKRPKDGDQAGGSSSGGSKGGAGSVEKGRPAGQKGDATPNGSAPGRPKDQDRPAQSPPRKKGGAGGPKNGSGDASGASGDLTGRGGNGARPDEPGDVSPRGGRSPARDHLPRRGGKRS